jgi:hypothetical protein
VNAPRRTRQQRVLHTIDVAIHHVTAYGNQHFVYCHPAGHNGIMMTDLNGGQYLELRVGDPGVRGHLCHFLMTRRGIAYEVPGLAYSGMYEPFTRRRFEFKLPPDLGYVHTGWDPEGRLWFYECSGKIHQMIALERLDEENGDQWMQLCGDWPTYGGGQKAHFHPQVTPDRKWILFTGGDPTTETNHISLLDASDLRDVNEISPEMLSATGEHDMTQAKPPKDLRKKAPDQVRYGQRIQAHVRARKHDRRRSDDTLGRRRRWAMDPNTANAWNSMQEVFVLRD